MPLSVDNMLILPKGIRFPVIRPDSLLTDWGFMVVERDDQSEVLDMADSLIPNSTRHYFISIDDRYSVDVVYQVNVTNNIGAVQSFGLFQVVQATFGPDDAANFYELNAQLKLAVGLAGLNTRIVHDAIDSVTGIPTTSTLYIYTDETFSYELARYRIKRRLNKVGQVIGEIMYRVMYDPSSLPVCPSEPSAEPSGT